MLYKCSIKTSFILGRKTYFKGLVKKSECEIRSEKICTKVARAFPMPDHWKLFQFSIVKWGTDYMTSQKVEQHVERFQLENGSFGWFYNLPSDNTFWSDKKDRSFE